MVFDTWNLSSAQTAAVSKQHLWGMGQFEMEEEGKRVSAGEGTDIKKEQTKGVGAVP